MDCVDKDGRTALNRAVLNGNEDMCKILISSGADVNFSYDIVQSGKTFFLERELFSIH